MATIPPLGSGFGVVQQRSPSGAPQPSADAPTAGGPEPAADSLQAVLDAVLKNSATRQNGLAPLFADLEALVARVDLPADVKAAVQALLGLQVPADAISSAALQKALARSGLFLEATLASGQYATPDLKAALSTLRAVLQNWLGSAPEAATRTPPPPPYPGAPPFGQDVADATIGALSLREAAAQVLAETDAALARQSMMQVISLPDPAGAAARQDAPQRLVMEIPLLTPHGTAIVGLQVERDARRAAGEEQQEPVWRIGFSVNLDPAGPIHARIVQIGERTNVSFTAERVGSADALNQELPTLRAMLAEAALEPGELHCRLGAPAKSTAAPGRLLDRAT
jgi:flagellar hook-length control protein FliK